MTQPSFSSDPYVPDRLIADSVPAPKVMTIQLIDNQTVGALSRGAVIGLHTDGTYAIVHQTGNFAGGKAYGILVEDADPSGGAVEAMIYVMGTFNEDALSFGGTVDADDVRAALAAYNVYLRAPTSA